MDRQIASGKITKHVIDILLVLLYLFLLGYAFTGGQLHEVAGIIFLVVIVIHNIINIKWYKSIKKGTYSKKRMLITALNIALLADILALVLTGILNSRYLFHTGVNIREIGRIHTILAVIGFALIVYHVMLHIFSHIKKKYKKLPVIMAILVCILAVLLDMVLLPYIKRHFDTVEINQENIISGESVSLGDRRILTVYFTRVGNTDFDDDVDAVSGASLLINENLDLLGNSQVIGEMIQNAVGGDILSINTKKKYPSSYSDTVSVASDELKSQELPELIDLPENLDEYDTVFIVYPLWWYTIPKPVEAFLKDFDFSGKTIIPVVTHGGSGAGKSIEAIKAVCNGTVMENPLEIYCGDVPYCRDSVTKWLKEVFE